MTSNVARAAGAAVGRGPGRPRNDDLDARIIEATLAIIDADEEVTVSRIVAHCGVSRAALYRRWPSLTALIAAALDVGRTVPPEFPTDGDLRATVFDAMLGDPTSVRASGYSDLRFRQRIRLVMADRSLQKAYWSSHVARRRVPIENLLRAGIKRGILRSDLDLEACLDAVAGAGYYQVVVRGEHIDDPAVHARLRGALEVVWRGMLA
ncbi:TetR/AcrR family transcriptional regulator [Rhodococcus sp. NPDC003318]|uniref:TetR/AcrR family transcriptional regulator n=1 Tax=Rhodococcus sp. NPDC003318 TaxID=3364503 RepID=UPI003679C0FB